VLSDVVFIEPLPEHRLRIRFDDGTEGIVDVTQLVEFTGVFEPLREPEFFTKVAVNTELGTVVWPNNADLDSDVLYAKVNGIPVPEYAPESKRA
jgi:hypothetical protein